jgi:hypothetical protein
MLDVRSAPIDLRVRPTAHKFQINQFTIGDLHANAIKLVHALIQNGVCAELSEEAYQRLVALYEAPAPLSAENFHAFNKFIDHELTVIEPNILVRLIGDLLADRGRNDWFVLKILKKLHDHGVNVRILMSNHDLEFLKGIGAHQHERLPATTMDETLSNRIEELETIIDSKDTSDEDYVLAMGEYIKITTFYERNAQGRSYIELEELIDNNLVRYEEVLSLVNDVYLPSLLLYDYSEADDKLTLFNHAHVDESEIASVALSLGLSPALESNALKKETISNINAVFRERMAFRDFSLFEKGTAAFRTIWQRERELHAEDDRDPRLSDSDSTIYVCGHDKSYKNLSKLNVINLDNSNGKSDLDNPEKDDFLAFLSNAPIDFLPWERDIHALKAQESDSESTVQILAGLKAQPRVDRRDVKKHEKELGEGEQRADDPVALLLGLSKQNHDAKRKNEFINNYLSPDGEGESSPCKRAREAKNL